MEIYAIHILIKEGRDKAAMRGKGKHDMVAHLDSIWDIFLSTESGLTCPWRPHPGCCPPIVSCPPFRYS